MINGPQPVARGNHHPAVQFRNQIHHRKPRSQWHQQPARTLHQQAVAAFFYALDFFKHFSNAEPRAVFFARPAARWAPRNKTGSFRGRQCAGLQGLQQPDVRLAAGTKRFHGQGAHAGFAQMMQQQGREQGLADARVRAGDKDDSRLFHESPTVMPGVEHWRRKSTRRHGRRRIFAGRNSQSSRLVVRSGTAGLDAILPTEIEDRDVPGGIAPDQCVISAGGDMPTWTTTVTSKVLLRKVQYLATCWAI